LSATLGLLLMLSPMPATPMLLAVDALQAQSATRAPRNPSDDLVGFAAFGDLVTWLQKLPAQFDRFVSSQKRDQLHRRFQSLADAFGKVNNDCVTLALLTSRDTTPRDQLHAEFERLFKSIVGLRATMLDLAKDLGEAVGDEGRDLAFLLATRTMMRANMTEEARQQVFGGDRGEAAKKLHQAAQLAEEAQKTVIGFLPQLR
jgi:hypothetical protein